MVGQTIRQYKIVEKLGEGGMGVVYKAEDSKLDRTVAVKFLPAHLIASADDRSRFIREAKAAAALNHPNIAVIYEINDGEDAPFIVMEYVEGQTLDQCVKREPFKLKDAIAIAVQIAEGLKAAHAKGIVHRDIKSSNVILTTDATAKILDFGLARTTMATQVTKTGSTLGTVAYMSPEQVSGLSVDHRTDLWSLGVILFEMLSGRVPFAGDYDQVIFYKILNEQPEPVTALRSGIPMPLEWVITKLLAKDPDERYQNATDLIIDLKAVDVKGSGFARTGQFAAAPERKNGGGGHIASEARSVRRQSWLMRRIIPIVAACASAIVAGLVVWMLRPQDAKEIRKYQWPAEYSFFVLSPDGKKIAYAKGEKLWIRRLDNIAPIEITTDDVIANVFWSPASDYAVFYTGLVTDTHELKKVSLSGVQSLITKTAGKYYPRLWGRDDSIIVTTWNENGWNTILKVPASGGDLTPILGGDSALAMVRGDLAHVAELPDGKTLLLSVSRGRSEIFAQTNERRVSVYTGPPESYIGRIAYAASGELLFPLFTRGSAAPDIWAVPFDASELRTVGSQFLVVRNADRPTVSENGMLSYTDVPPAGGGEQLVLLSRTGQLLKYIGRAQYEIHAPAVAPDGRRIATTSANEAGAYAVWVHDVARGVSSQLSFDIGEPWKPSWSPDGKELVFQAGFFENGDILRLATDGRTTAVPVVRSKEFESEPVCTRDGKRIVYATLETEPHRQNDLWYVETSSGAVPQRLFASRFNETFPSLSPDGRYLSFVSDKSGQVEVYVTDFPKAEQQYQVSYGGGVYAQWIGDEIFFVNQKTNKLLSARVRTRPEFQADMPRELFAADSAGVQLQIGADFTFKYTVTPDGKNIIAVKKLGASGGHSVTIVEQWIEEFHEKK